MKWKQMSDNVQKEISEFAFGKKGIEKPLDTNSRIEGRNMMMMLSLMRVYEGYLGSRAAPIIAETLERLSWSLDGESRKEAVFSLTQGMYFPSQNVPSGFEEFGVKREAKEKK